MNAAVVLVDHTPGRLFAGTIADTYCFVPLGCLREENEPLRLHELEYVRSRWDVRNMRANLTSEGGERLFPDLNRLIDDMTMTDVRDFLRRIRRIQSEPVTHG